MVHGVTQAPIEGVSMAYTFDDAAAGERHTTQYFEMYGNPGIYHDGWIACTRHRIPWEVMAQAAPLDDDVWELYGTRTNWTQYQPRDLAATQLGKLRELQRLFILEASKCNVFPLDDRLAELTGARSMISRSRSSASPAQAKTVPFQWQQLGSRTRNAAVNFVLVSVSGRLRGEANPSVARTER